MSKINIFLISHQGGSEKKIPDKFFWNDNMNHPLQIKFSRNVYKGFKFSIFELPMFFFIWIFRYGFLILKTSNFNFSGNT